MKAKVYPCPKCEASYLTEMELHSHQTTMTHFDEYREPDNSGYAFAFGGLAGVGAYKLYKRLKKK